MFLDILALEGLSALVRSIHRVIATHRPVIDRKHLLNPSHTFHSSGSCMVVCDSALSHVPGRPNTIHDQNSRCTQFPHNPEFGTAMMEHQNLGEHLELLILQSIHTLSFG